MNAVKHGITAWIALLPDEDPAAFRETVIGWIADLRPSGRVESFLTERAAYCSLRLERVTRGASARLCFKAHTAAEEKATRIGQEVTQLSQVLFKPALGRTAAHPFATQSGDSASAVTTGGRERGDHPAVVVGRLEGSGAGCRWLRERWQELGALLEDGLKWRAPERFRVFRLLGIHPADALFTADLTSLLRGCEALDPGAGSVVSEIWNEMVSAEELPSLLETYERASRHMGVPDEAAARQHLLGVVTRAIERLDERLEKHAMRDELESALADHLNAVDTSREGALMRRYEQTCERTLFQVINELKERQAAMEEFRRQAFLLPEFRPSASLLTALRSSRKSKDGAELAESDQYHDRDGEAAMNDEGERDGRADGELLRRNEPSQGLGGCMEVGSEQEGDLRNEASSGIGGCAEVRSGQEDCLRNEASRAEVDVAVAGSERGSGLRNEPSSEFAGCGEGESGQEGGLRIEVSRGAGSCRVESGQEGDLRNEASSAARGSSKHALGGNEPSENVITIAVEAAGNVAEGARAAVFTGIRRDRGHGNLLEASRRERRRRKREQRRARRHAR